MVIEHYMQVIMTVCSRVVVMHEEACAEGTPGEIQNNPDVARVYLGSKRVHQAAAGER